MYTKYTILKVNLHDHIAKQMCSLTIEFTAMTQCSFLSSESSSRPANQFSWRLFNFGSSYPAQRNKSYFVAFSTLLQPPLLPYQINTNRNVLDIGRKSLYFPMWQWKQSVIRYAKSAFLSMEKSNKWTAAEVINGHLIAAFFYTITPKNITSATLRTSDCFQFLQCF